MVKRCMKKLQRCQMSFKITKYFPCVINEPKSDHHFVPSLEESDDDNGWDLGSFHPRFHRFKFPPLMK